MRVKIASPSQRLRPSRSSPGRARPSVSAARIRASASCAVRALSSGIARLSVSCTASGAGARPHFSIKRRKPSRSSTA